MRYQHVARSATRLALVHTLSRALPVYVVNEFPKSGGTWIANLLSGASGIRFRDNRTPRLEKQIIKGHFFRRGGIRNCLVVWRDGRDAISSFYYHNYFKFSESSHNHKRVDYMRAKYPFDDYDDIRANLPSFIGQIFERPISPAYTWSQFVDRWSGYNDFVHVRYEDMRKDPQSELTRVVQELTGLRPELSLIESTIERFDIDRIKQQRSEHHQEGETYFVREGKLGGWSEVFSAEADELFRRYAQPQLEKLGYE
ncbi:MAG: sulfotransferase domain-containing protein [Acidobacteriota bacterium]|nr:sulfotransferase domain-containing protein [Acidobacteriota bacterium]